MAEAILTNMKLEDVFVKSAGIYALDGGDMSENAKQVLLAQDMFIQHSSKPITSEDLQWATIILTMTNAHKQLVLQMYPSVENKIFTLKEYVAPYTSKDISDPFGGDYQQYEHTFLEIKQYIDILKGKLESYERTEENEI